MCEHKIWWMLSTSPADFSCCERFIIRCTDKLSIAKEAGFTVWKIETDRQNGKLFIQFSACQADLNEVAFFIMVSYIPCT